MIHRPRTQPARPAVRVHTCAVLMLALFLRVMVVSIVVFTYPRTWLYSKAPDLGFLAHSISSGHGLSSPFGGSTGPSAFVAPGYPLLLAGLFRIFGSYNMTAGICMMGLQTLFALLTILCILSIAHQVFDARVANLAGCFWALSPPLLWLPVLLWETSLSILLLTAMVALAGRCVRQPDNVLWATAGVYCGFAILVNPSLTLALCALLAWAAWQTRFFGHQQPWLCVITLLLVVAPWPWRNARVLHAFIPLRSNLGYEVWQGNHEGASGLFDPTLEPLQSQYEYAQYAAAGEVAYMHGKTLLARAYIVAHPALFFTRSAARVVRFWLGAGSAENSTVVELHATLTSLLGLAGLIMLLRLNATAGVLFLIPVLFFPLPYYITHPDFRFRLVLDPLLTMLSAYLVVCLHRWWRSNAAP